MLAELVDACPSTGSGRVVRNAGMLAELVEAPFDRLRAHSSKLRQMGSLRNTGRGT
jgi:hypothetical protein